MKFDDTVPYAIVLTFHSPLQDQRLSSVVHRSGPGYTASQIFLLLPQIQCLSHPMAYVPASPSGSQYSTTGSGIHQCLCLWKHCIFQIRISFCL